MFMPKPTATLHDAHRWEYRRNLPATASDLWLWITVSELTEQWFGPFVRISDTEVAVTMTAEEPGPPMNVAIIRCEAPRHLDLDTGIWQLFLEVGEGYISLFHAVENAEEAAAIGPGWEFYLDRLAAAFNGGDVESIDFESDYYPAMSEYFTSQY